MRRLALSLLVAATVCVGCASTAPDAHRAYTFERDGVSYAIVAIETSSQAVNDLVRIEDGRLLFRARDRDQDGTLDTLLVSALSLVDANAIYAYGIERARAQGRYRVQEPAQMYVLPLPSGRLVVWSIARGGSDWSNRLARYNVGGHLVWTCEDTDADGHLDTGVEPHVTVPEHAHAAYASVLDEGQRAGQIEVIGSRYRVRPSAHAAR